MLPLAKSTKMALEYAKIRNSTQTGSSTLARSSRVQTAIRAVSAIAFIARYSCAARCSDVSVNGANSPSAYGG